MRKKNAGGGEANQLVPKGRTSRSSPPADPTLDPAAIDAPPEGHCANSAAVERLCGDLMGLQRQRRFCIVTQSRADRSAEAFVRTRLGFRTDMTEPERKALSAEARRIKRIIERGEGQGIFAGDGQNTDVLADCSMIILGAAASRRDWDQRRLEVEKKMRELARLLPAHGFVAGIKGVSELTLAVVAGEAGNLSRYPKHGHLWKRLGLAVLDGVRQGGLSKNASAEDWIRHGYSRKRRAEIWAFVDDVMLRHQWRAAVLDDDDNVLEPAHPIGPYGEAYGRKKAEYVLRGHPAPDKAARRYMAKKFVRDLWKAWWAAEEVVLERDITCIPPATLAAAA